MIKCDYGCGQKALFQLKNGKWCCGKSHNSCLVNKRKNGESKKGQKCYLYGKEMAEEYRKKISKSMKKSAYWKGKKLSTEHRRKMSESHKGKILSDDQKQKISQSILGFKHTKEAKRKIKESKFGSNNPMWGNTLKIETIKNKYPLFSIVELMRYNPDKLNEIQVHCKNHNCSNSKEHGGWFTPTYNQIRCRINQLEHKDGNDGSYFYCSDECKNECPLYNLNPSSYINGLSKTEKVYTQEEYQIFREQILNRDNYICQYCGKLAEHAHHERPQKLEPFFSLDPDLAWSVCSKCHYKYGHKDECSTGKLANKIC